MAYDKNTGAKILIIGWHPHQPVVVVEGDEIYTLSPTDISLEKPETPEQKCERERLESAYDLYRFAMDSGGYKIVCFDKFIEHYSKTYIAIVDKTGYRK